MQDDPAGALFSIFQFRLLVLRPARAKIRFLNTPGSSLLRFEWWPANQRVSENQVCTLFAVSRQTGARSAPAKMSTR